MRQVSSQTEKRLEQADVGDVAKRFLSPRQMAERWDCSPTTAQRIAKNAGIAKYCLGEGKNGMVRYLLSEVETYEEERRVACIS